MGHLHPVYDTDPHFHLDPVTRGISHTTSEKLIIIQGDHNSQVYTFDIPRYVDGHDMTLCNLVQVHYINTDGTNSMNRNTGVYEVLDLQISPEDPNVCVCSWLISQEATKFVGRLSFTLRFACMDGTKLTYNWNSTVYDGVTVATSYDHSDTVIDNYGDILEQWYLELYAAGVTGVNVIDEAKEKAISEIESVLYEYGGIALSETEPTDDRNLLWIKPSDPAGTIRVRNVESDNFETITLNTLKGSDGDPTNFITSEFGNDENLAISQARFSAQIDNLESGLNDVDNTCNSLISDVNCLNQDVYQLLISKVLGVNSDIDDSERLLQLEQILGIKPGSDMNISSALVDIEQRVNMIVSELQLDQPTNMISALLSDINDIRTHLGYSSSAGTYETLSYFNSRIAAIEEKNWDVESIINDVRILQSLTNFDTAKYDAMYNDIVYNKSKMIDHDNSIGRIDSDISSIKETNSQQTDRIEAIANLLNDIAVNINGLAQLSSTVSNLITRVEWLEAKYAENHE